MKRLERIVDMIGVFGIEQTETPEAFPIEEQVDLFATFSDNLLNQKIREKINSSSLAAQCMHAMLNTANGEVKVKASNVSPTDQEILIKMINQVQGVKSVNVDVL